MPYTKEDINNMIRLKGAGGKLIDIFDLHGVLFVGNTENGKWDLSKTYIKFSEHSLGFTIKDFEDCETFDQVNERFTERLREAVCEKLV